MSLHKTQRPMNSSERAIKWRDVQRINEAKDPHNSIYQERRDKKNEKTREKHAQNPLLEIRRLHTRRRCKKLKTAYFGYRFFKSEVHRFKPLLRLVKKFEKSSVKDLRRIEFKKHQPANEKEEAVRDNDDDGGGVQDKRYYSSIYNKKFPADTHPKLRLTPSETEVLVAMIEKDLREQLEWKGVNFCVGEIRLLKGGTVRQGWHSDVGSLEEKDSRLSEGSATIVSGSILYALKVPCSLDFMGYDSLEDGKWKRNCLERVYAGEALFFDGWRLHAGSVHVGCCTRLHVHIDVANIERNDNEVAFLVV